MTDIQSASPATILDSSAPPFSAEMFAAFWAAPDLSRGMDILADDIVGYWPGDPEPVRESRRTPEKIAELLAAAPDLRLELVDSATVPVPPTASNWSSCTTSAAEPARTGHSRSAGSTGSAPATAWWWRT